jgi:ribosome maturation factor RimP
MLVGVNSDLSIVEGRIMSREETAARLLEMIEPLVQSKGYELVKLDYAARKHGLLHLIIDHEKGVTVDDCEIISRAVSELLDSSDPITHAYTLEVSSPGLERPLTKKDHFARFKGEKVKIRTDAEVNGSDKFAGTLVSAESEYITVRGEDGKLSDIPYQLIKKANLWYTKPERKRTR